MAHHGFIVPGVEVVDHAAPRQVIAVIAVTGLRVEGFSLDAKLLREGALNAPVVPIQALLVRSLQCWRFLVDALLGQYVRDTPLGNDLGMEPMPAREHTERGLVVAVEAETIAGGLNKHHWCPVAPVVLPAVKGDIRNELGIQLPIGPRHVNPSVDQI